MFYEKGVNMQDIWQRIESWLGANAPKILAGLLPGAIDEAIRSTEEQLAVCFPRDVRASYAIHDGQRGTAPSFMGEWDLLSLEAVVKQWNLLKELLDAGTFTSADAVVETVGPVRGNWWNAKWIPVTHNGAGDFYCLDMDPAPGGKQGQIITYWHVNTPREKIADSFQELMKKFADDLYADKYRVKEDMLVFRD
jgi:cell wall assembly regulator SMI1